MRRRLVSDMKPTGRERRYRVAASQVLRDAAATLVASAEDLGASPMAPPCWIAMDADGGNQRVHITGRQHTLERSHTIVR